MQSHHQPGGFVVQARGTHLRLVGCGKLSLSLDGTHVHNNARSWKAWAHRIGHHFTSLANECKYLKQQPTYIHLASGSPAGLNYGDRDKRLGCSRSDWGACRE